MNPWYGYAALLMSLVIMLIIRAPHGQRSRKTKVIDNRKTPLEITFVALTSVTMILLPLALMTTQLLDFANYELRPAMLLSGCVFMMYGLWLFYRSHADLGKNWSVSLELRENHSLVDKGVYRHIRHPMYTAIFLYCFGQAMLLSNWFIGVLTVGVFFLLYVFRVKKEEQMMREQFPIAYVEYMQRTKRLVPGIY